MKRILGVTVAVLATVGAMAQGTVNFANLGAGVNAPIFDVDNTTKLGAGFSAQLWAGATAGSLAAVSAPISFSTSVAGVFLGGSTVVPGVPTGSPAFYQVRVWNSGGGFATWGDAITAATGGNAAAKFGFNGINYSNPLAPAATILQTPNLGGGVIVPPNLTSLTSFHLVQVPEPSVIALGILGAGALLLRRRK